MKNNRKNRKRVRMLLKAHAKKLGNSGVVREARVIGKVRIIKGIPYGQVSIMPFTSASYIEAHIGFGD